MSKDESDVLRRATQYSTLGLTFTIILALGIFGGVWLDGRLSTSPLFILLGLIGSMVVGIYHLIKSVNRLETKRDDTPDQQS